MNARISIGGYEPKHLSWSTYDSYSSCGERQRLQKVLMLEQRPNWGSVGGTGVHDSVEVIEAHGPDLGPLADWHGFFDTTVLFNEQFDAALQATLERSPSFGKNDWHVSQNRGNPKNEDWWRTEGPKMLDRYIAWRQQTAWTVWGIEVECNFTLPGDIPIKAFIDNVSILPTGQAAVVDVKTGKIPDTPGQLGLYKVALKTLFDMDVQWGFFWDAKKGSHGQPIDLSQYTPEFMADLFEQAIAGHNAGVFLPKPQMNCATWCGVARYCKAVGGELADTVPSVRDLLDIRSTDASH